MKYHLQALQAPVVYVALNVKTVSLILHHALQKTTPFADQRETIYAFIPADGRLN